MRMPLILLFTATAVVSAWAQTEPDNLVLIKGGTFKNTRSQYYAKSATSSSPYISKLVNIPDMYFGKYEVTQKEWTAAMGRNPSKFRGDTLPVERVNWYDAVEYCNQRSIKEGLRPYYHVDRDKPDPDNQNEIDDLKWTVTINPGANGYRLPTEAEWEYAAGGGQLSKNHRYSGSDEIDRVAWYWANAGDRPLTGYWSWRAVEQNHDQTKPVGSKQPNELGLYDMSGNVREWCWNWYADSPSNGTGPRGSKEGRVWRGGGWMGGDFCCVSTFRAGYEASGKGADQGFRVCRDR